MKLIFIVADTLRRDHLSCYGYFRKTSPFIDKLAKEGVLFEDSFASAVATGPGFTSLFTGLPAIQHRFYFTPHNLPNMINFDDDWPTLPELIQYGSNYTTCALDNLINFQGHMKHMVRGFEYYINSSGDLLRPSHLIGKEVNKRDIPWIREHKKEDFFLFLHYWDPHTPYNQPEEYKNIFQHKLHPHLSPPQPPHLLSSPSRGEEGKERVSRGRMKEGDLEVKEAPAGYKYVPGWGKLEELEKEMAPLYIDPKIAKDAIDLYDGEIRYLDDLLQELFSCLKEENLLQETVIVFTSDHGEYLGDIHQGKKIYGHPGIHFPDTNVPLIFWGPQFFASGRRVGGYVQQIDTTRTILEILNISKRPDLPGENLLPYLKGAKKEIEKEFIVCESNVHFLEPRLGRRSLIQGDWEYIWNLDGAEELYNLKDDPCERIDLKEKEGGVLVKLRQKLTQWRNRYIPDSSFDPIYKACTLLEKHNSSLLSKRGSFWDKGKITPVDYY